MILDLLRWWLTVQVLSLCALPITTWFFRRLPDRGYSFAKPLGLLLVGYGAWLVSMLGLGTLTSMLLWSSALAVLALGIAAWSWSSLGLMIRDLRARWGWIALHEALFVVALYIGIVLRWRDLFGSGVAISHTEQPMDLTFISGILASPQFPPQDPWLASYPINYYYLGYLLIAALIRLSGVSVGVGYTLGIATIFAFTATGVAGIVWNLIKLGEKTEETAKRSSIQHLIWPVAAAVFVLIAGNQAGALQVLAGSEKVVALPASQLVTAVRNGLTVREPLDLGPSFPVGPGQFDDAVLVPRDAVEDFNAWWPSRTLWDTLSDESGQTRREYAITEFPFFSFLLGDLHPHVLSLPWSLLALAVSLNVLVRPRAPEFRTRRGAGELILTAIVLGGLYAINSWDLPTYLVLYLGALTLLYLRLAHAPRQFFWAHYVQQAGMIVVASYVVYLPFHLSFAAPTQGFPIGLSPARTSLTEFLIIFGLFFVPLVFWSLASGAWRLGDQRQQGVSITHHVPRFTIRSITNDRWSVAALLAMLLVFGMIVGWPLFFLLALALVACLAAYHHREQPGTAFALWAFALGALVIWGVDLIYLRDNYGSPRMNTIFKFYYQVWLVWGTLAAYALWALLRHGGPRWRMALWLVPFTLLLWGSLVYPALAPSDMPADRTLDGLAYLKQRAPDEAAAIEWVRNNTPEDSVVLQAPGRPYNANTARIASATGRPTVIGWDQHERLWRGGQPGLVDEVQARTADVTTIYTTADVGQAQSLLDHYSVQYVYVGSNERALALEHGAPPEALTKFDTFMQRVWEQGDAVIYARR